MKKVLVVGNHVTSLNIIRSLGKKGIPVYLTDQEKICIGRFSKYCQGFFHSPTHFESQKYVNFLIQLAESKNLRDAILIPTNDYTVSILSQNKDRLSEYYKIPLPHWEVINRVFDKRQLLEIAEKNGIPIPRAIYPLDKKDMEKKISELEYPVVVKPAFGKDYYFAKGVKMHMAYVFKEAEQHFDSIASVMGEQNIIVQEYIPGGNGTLFNYAAVMRKGIPHGIFTGKKIRQHPRDFGVGTATQIVNEPELTRLGTLLFKSCQYEGVGYIEFKKDPRDGKFKLIEINARLWNSMDLAVCNGIDLPYIIYLYALNKKMPQNHSTGNMKWIHWWPDFGQTLKEVLKKKENFRDYFKSFKGEKKFAVIDLSDPLPFLMETLFLPYILVSR